MSKFKILNEKDLEILNLSEEELQEVDEKLLALVNLPESEQLTPCCRSCNCSRFRQGTWPNPSTTCNNCGHSWNVHRC